MVHPGDPARRQPASPAPDPACLRHRLVHLATMSPGHSKAGPSQAKRATVMLVGPVYNINIYGGQNHIGSFDQQTYDFAKTKVVGDRPEVFVGNVASLNANTFAGRFYLHDEERTVSFKPAREVRLTNRDLRLLSWSLDEYANGNDGTLRVTGVPLRSRYGILKSIFVHNVARG